MKFERNPCIRFRDNCDMDDGRTKVYHRALLTESSRAKNVTIDGTVLCIHLVTAESHTYTLCCNFLHLLLAESLNTAPVKLCIPIHVHV